MQVNTSYTNSILGIFSSQGKNDTTASSVASGAKNEDEVAISGSAVQQLQTAMGVLETSSASSKSANRQDLSDMSNNISKKISAILINNQIYGHGDMDFKINSYGKIEVSGDVANKDAIEKTLNSDPSLMNDIAEAISTAKSIASAEIEREYKIRLDGGSENEDEEDEEEKKRDLLKYQEDLTVKVQSLMNQVNGANSLSMNSAGAISYQALAISSSFTGMSF